MAKKNTEKEKFCDDCIIDKRNAELRYEIDLLKKQIDNLNNNSISLQQQNSLLKEKIEDTKKNKKQLEKIQREKDDLFALIIHDIKNPTTVIKGLVELLGSYDTNSTEQQAIINDLLISTKQIIALSTEISKVLTLEGTSIQMYKEWANPAQLLIEIVQRNSINAKNKEQTINIEMEKNMPQFQVDVVKIMEVFENLLSNAIKYTQFGGKIGISAKKKDYNTIEINFSDNGLGISEEDLKRAFQKGAKLSAKPTGGETSSGLGLWIVKKIVEAHNGRVWIKSSLGKGTVFTLHIPIIAVANKDN